MKLKLNKKNLKNLSRDNALLPLEATPQIAGGGREKPTTGVADNSGTALSYGFSCSCANN